MSLFVRNAVPADVPRLLEIYAQARGIMRRDGNLTQWSGAYPSEERIREDIGRGYCHVIEQDGVPVACFALIIGPDPTYARIYEGRWLEDTLPYGTIHRLASTPDSHGIAQACFDWCSGQIANLRVDTHADNHIMQHVIRKAGFSYCGIIYLADGSPRLAYQKLSD